MNEMHKLIEENQEQRELIRHLQSSNEILNRDMQKYRSQAMMRQNAKEQLQEEVAFLKQQLEQAYE